MNDRGAKPLVTEPVFTTQLWFAHLEDHINKNNFGNIPTIFLALYSLS